MNKEDFTAKQLDIMKELEIAYQDWLIKHSKTDIKTAFRDGYLIGQSNAFATSMRALK